MSIDNLIEQSKDGINEIKLKDLLSIREDANDNAMIKTLFPPIGLGSITLVDQIVLLSLAQIIKPTTIVEIGTFLGYTTSILAMNTHAKIFTIDLPKTEELINLAYDDRVIRQDGNENDNFLRKTQATEGEKYINDLSPDEKRKIVLIKADSTSLNFKNEFDCAEFVFIDGGHEKKIVEKDTLNARSIIKDGVIVWHDFGSQIHNDVTEYLNGLRGRSLFHVKGSLCAFELIKSSGV